jgi:glutamate/tyrosine decarboxylase-like PLP-dependent enzyme
MSSLFPSGETRYRLDHGLTDALANAHERLVRGSVTPTFNLESFRTQLAAIDFRRSWSLDDILSWTVEQMEHGIVHVNHPRYFGLFNPTPTFPAQCADRITAVFNPQLATWATSPAAVEIESHVINSVARRVGFRQEAFGHFTSGGTEANYTSVILALNRVCPGFADVGVRSFSGPPVLYASKDCHGAWLKIAVQAGLGRSAVRLVPTDGSGRIGIPSLIEAIDIDRAQGRVPFMIVATAGTTNAGMIDPLVGCAEVAAQWDLWFHIDAAWGGGLIASDSMRAPLTGIERADSITIDAHKWLATTMGCGMFITRRPNLLSSAFHTSADYMPSNAVNIDPYVTTPQWSRRFLGLRLFLSLAVAGWDGYSEHVEHALSMINLLGEQMTACGWKTANASPVGVLCLVPRKPHAVRPIVKHVLASGQAWVSVAEFEGRDVIRVCVTSGLTTADDIYVLRTALTQAEDDSP